MGRFLGLPIAATIVISSEHFHGQVRATEAPENASPEELVAAAETLCSHGATLEFALGAGPEWATVGSPMCGTANEGGGHKHCDT